MEHCNVRIIEPLVIRLSLHTDFRPCELDILHKLPARIVEVMPRRDFVRLGERSTEVTIVETGLVGRFDQNRQGDRQVVALYLPGEMPDLHTVVVPRSRIALHAFTECRVIRVPHAALLDAANTHAAIAVALWRESALDAVRVSTWVLSIGRKEAISRLAHLLCEFACRTAGNGKPGTAMFDFPITQVDLGDLLGLSPVHVNRTLRSLRLANLVSHERSRVRILDWEELVKVADFDPSYLTAERLPPQSDTKIRAFA